MFYILYAAVVLLGSWTGGFGWQLSSPLDRIFAILTDGNNGCDITTIQDKIEWCNGTINSANLVPDFTACQVEDQYESHLLCRNGEWSKENRFRHKGRTKRAAISDVIARERKHTCTWICALEVSDIIGKSRPSYQSCPNSTVLYPTGNSTDIIHEWVYPVAADQDGNITSFQQIVGPTSPSTFASARSPGNVYHVSYMAEDDDKLKWTCYFTIKAEIPICPAFIDFAFGEYTCDNETNRGSICEFRCEEGYYLNTTNTTVCQDDGSWSFGEDRPECLPIRCGNVSVNSSEVAFMCYDESDVFGTVCWARCPTGYILRNELQEEQQQEMLREMVAAAKAELNRTEKAKFEAEEFVNQATIDVLKAEREAARALSVNVSLVNKIATLQEEIKQLSTEYNQTLILAQNAVSDTQEAIDNQQFDIVDELLALTLNLTTKAEELNTRHIEANEELINATQDALQADGDATEAINQLSAAQMYLNETEINLEMIIDEIAEALEALDKTNNTLNAAIEHAGLENKIINSYAKCGLDGTWNIQGEPYCIDTEPPLLKCIPIYSLYLEAGHTTTPGNWPRPEIYEDTTGTATVYHLSGPAEGAPLEPGQYEVKYRARDAADNVSPVCTILINVEVHSCSSITSEISDENLVADCDSYTAGATCSLSCLNNYKLDGDDIVVCEDDSRTEKIDYLWNDMNNTACIVEECPMLLEPVDGNMTCENTTDGEKCIITCSEGYRLPYGLANVYQCDETGSWSPAPQQLSCYENDEVQVAVYSLSISYLSSNECYQYELDDQQIAIDTALKAYLQSFQSCEEDYECMMGATEIECQEDEELVRFLLNIITTCPENTGTDCDLAFIIMDIFERDIKYFVEDAGILDHLNLTLTDDWLSPVSVDLPGCEDGSVLIGAFCEKCGIGAFLETSRSSSRCVLCPKDTYTDTIGQPICKVCPPGTGTLNTGATSAEDCKELCNPGSYSQTTMEPCLKCKPGTYQPNKGKTNCTNCPDGTWTTISGANTEDMCINFDMYVATELEPEEIDIGEITFAVSANFWIKGFDIPILTLGLFYDETDFAFQLVTEENIQIFTDGWDNTPTNVLMASDEWIMLTIVWNMQSRDIRLYKNSDLAFTMKTKESSSIPTKLLLSVKEETFLSSFVVFPYELFPQLINTAYSECVPLPGLNVLSMLASLRRQGLNPIPSTCRASNVTDQDNCGNHDCQNDGTCQHNDTVGYTCICTEEYGGHFCEVKLVHGNWSEWMNGTECSVTCGIGIREIYRLCNSPQPGLYGNSCVGNSTDLVECLREQCQECDDLTDESGTICILKDDECTPTCPEGRVLPKGQYQQKYRCGISTNYEWIPLNRLPVCASTSQAESYEIVATFDVTPAVPCTYHNNMTTLYDNAGLNLTCQNCFAELKAEGCGDVTVLKIKLQASLTQMGTFDLEEYFATGNATESIYETIEAIEGLEKSIMDILDQPDILTIVVDNITYTILPATAYIIAMTACRSGFVDTQGVCVKCQPGTRQNGGWCVYCDRGTYQDSSGQSGCTPCPIGETTDFVGARSEAECIEIVTEPTPPPPPADITGILVGVSLVLGIILIVLIVLVILKFYITHKRRRQFDMEAETASLFTEFPDIAYNTFFKKKQVLGFDEYGIPVIAHDTIDDGDKKQLLFNESYPFNTDVGNLIAGSMPPVEPFSFSSRPVNDMPFDHPPPQLKKTAFMKPSIDPIKHFNFPNMRELPVRFKVPKRKRFQNKFPRHTFGLPEEEDPGYMSQKVPIPKNATKLLYKSPTGENLYAYLFKDGTIGKMSPRSDDGEGGIEPDLSLLRAQYLDDDGFEHPPPVFTNLKLNLKENDINNETATQTQLRLKGKPSFDSRPSTAKTLSRPSTAKTLSRPSTAKTISRPSTAKTLSRPSTTKSRGRASTSARSTTDSNLDSFRSSSSTGTPRAPGTPRATNKPRAKSAFLRSGNKSVKSVSIKEATVSPRPSTARTQSGRPKSSALPDNWMLEVAETYRPKSIGNVSDVVENRPISALQPGTPLAVPTAVHAEQETESVPLKDQKMKLMSPPFVKENKISPESVTNNSNDHLSSEEQLEEELNSNLKTVHFDSDIKEQEEIHDKTTEDQQDADEPEPEPDSDSSGSVIYSKAKNSVKRGSQSSHFSMNGGPVPKPIIPKGMKAMLTSKGFIENLNLPVPPRGHQIKTVLPTTESLNTASDTHNI